MLSSPPRRQFLCGYLARVRFVISLNKKKPKTNTEKKYPPTNQKVMIFVAKPNCTTNFWVFFEFSFHFFIHWQSNILWILSPPSHISFPFCAIIMCVVKGRCKFWGTWIVVGIGATVVWVRFGNMRNSLLLVINLELSRSIIYLEVRFIM